MKVLSKKEVETEVEFPTPSFWKEGSSHLKVTDNYIISTTPGIVVVFEKKETAYEERLQEIMNPPVYKTFEQVDETDFLNAYNKALTNIAYLVTDFEPVF
ncbi:MAG TPA: hypothetical protein VN726_22980 [Hanamia sp.]|nr:hypothetical protein [Hanamia sp.]